MLKHKCYLCLHGLQHSIALLTNRSVNTSQQVVMWLAQGRGAINMTHGVEMINYKLHGERYGALPACHVLIQIASIIVEDNFFEGLQPCHDEGKQGLFTFLLKHCKETCISKCMSPGMSVNGR